MQCFFAGGTEWTVDPTAAVVAEGDDAIDALLASAGQSAAKNLVVDPELIPAKETDGGYYPAHIKQIMQAKGPSVRPDLGYQVSPVWEQNSPHSQTA